ncbi:hypothetical protein [Dictyobacter formicarum]|uniref:Uncharacterized protein n=1 Tax=Dictyobacter formicarum TaxID=2778368 RepID=A0ABQ3VQW0_9CHLR|nr:hypothetical protein [Dictyobacter formicarum]GHO88132.1 hypothetical protein KSZ_61380 [Dictyobacter formicarum]GHO88252.1 hypothetical protein KSZ_62580 [Dictyobacter formicarum]
MADGDIVHPTLPLGYQHIYKGICEEVIDEESLARQVLRRLIKDKDKYGDAPLEFIQRAALLFEQLAANLRDSLSVDWSLARQDMNELGRVFSGSQRGLQLALRACEQQLDLLERHHHQGILPDDFAQDITQQYLLNIYDERFVRRVPQTREHYQGVHPQFVQERITTMRPFVISGIANLAHQIVENKALRLLPRQVKLQKIDLDKDLDRDLLDLL